MDLTSVLFMNWQIGNSEKNNCVIFNTIQGVFALSSYLDGLQPVFIYRQTLLNLVSSLRGCLKSPILRSFS